MDTFYLQDGDEVHRVDVEGARDIYVFADHGDEEIAEDRVLVEMGYEPGSQCSRFVGMLGDRHFIEAFTTSEIWSPEVVARFLIELARSWSIPALPPENYTFTVSTYRSKGSGSFDDFEITPEVFVDRSESFLDMVTKEHRYMDPDDDEDFDDLHHTIAAYYDIARIRDNEVVENNAVSSLDYMLRCVGDLWAGAYNVEAFYKNARRSITEALHVALYSGRQEALGGDELSVAVFFVVSDLLRITSRVTQAHKDEL
jgi:hypothetical protein